MRYFGPYSHAWAVRESLDLLTRVFPMRTCSKGVYNRHERLGRPCLLGYIGKCDAPCIGRVSKEEHRETVNELVSFMNGNTAGVRRKLVKDMEAAAENLEFERAARLRDDLGAIDKIMEQQAVVFADGTDADLIAFNSDELEAAVQIFHVRGGRIRGQRGWVVERAGDQATSEPIEKGQPDPALPALVQNFLIQFYSDAVEREEQEAREDAALAADVPRRGVDQESHMEQRHVHVIPREILVQAMPEESEQVVSLLEDLRGARVDLRVPQRGDKRSLMDTVEKNAKEQLRQHKLKRVGDLTARSAALQDIQDALGMDQAPLRIECTDISHIQGTDVVASLVVLKTASRRNPITGATASRKPPATGIPMTSAPLQKSRGAGLSATTKISWRTRTRKRKSLRSRKKRWRKNPPRQAAALPILLSCSSWTAARPRWLRRKRYLMNWALSMSPSWGWPSAWKKFGCQAMMNR